MVPGPALLKYMFHMFTILIIFYTQILQKFELYKLSVKKTQKIISGPNVLPVVGAPQICSAPGFAFPKTATVTGTSVGTDANTLTCKKHVYFLQSISYRDKNGIS